MANAWWQDPNQQDQNAWWDQPSFFGNLATDQETEHKPSFFGGIAHDVGATIHGAESVVKGVGSFFGGMVKSIGNDAVQAGRTVRNIASSAYTNDDVNEKIDANTKAMQSATHDYQSGKISLDELNQKYAQFKQDSQKQSDRLKNERINTDKTSPLKQGASTANTYLNLATLGVEGGVKSLAEGGARQIATDLGENGVRSALGTTGKVLLSNGADVAERAALHDAVGEGGETAAKAALQHFGTQVGGNALFGGASGALNTAEDPNATGADAWRNALIGAATAGVIGGGSSLLNKDVRVGLKEVPGQVTDRAQMFGDALSGKTTPLNEVGSVKNPFFKSPDEAAGPRPGNAVPPEQDQIAQDVASHYSSPKQYVDEAAKSAYNFDKSQSGGDLLRKTEANQPDSFTRTSSHTPFYREYFSDTGRAPSQSAFRDQIEKALATGNDGGGIIDPAESKVYQLLVDREGSQQALLNDPTAGYETLRQQHMDAINGTGDGPAIAPSVPGSAPPLTRSRMPGGLPKGPQGTAPLTGLEPETPLQPRYDDPAALQAALGRGEAQTNPLIDYIDPNATPVATPTTQGELPVAPPNPYAGAEADLNRPALGPGETPTVTPGEAKRAVKAGNEPAGQVLNEQRPGTKPIALPATTAEGENIATRVTPAGNVVPLANNNAHVSKDELAAIRAIGEDNRAGQFKFTRTPEDNLAEALAPRGGAKSEEFKVLNQNNTDLREAKGRISDQIQSDQKNINDMVKKAGWDRKTDEDPLVRAFLEASDDTEASKVLAKFAMKYGDKKAGFLTNLKGFGQQIMESRRTAANDNIVKYAGEDRAIGKLENYWPRATRRGRSGDILLDLKNSGLSHFNGEGDMMNLSAGEDKLNKITETTGDSVRQVNQAPLNSNLAKPNTSFLSQAQHRLAPDAQGKQMGGVASLEKYLRDVTRAGELTPVIAKGRSLQKAVELVHGETGNLRQMYDSLGDQINAVAGKTNRLDQVAINSEGGNKAVNIASKMQARISRSTILGSANSAIAQTGQLPLIAVQAGPKNFADGMGDVIKYALSGKKDNPISLSALWKDRYPGYHEDSIVTQGNKAAKAATALIKKPFDLIEKASSDLAWYSNYHKVLEQGLAPMSKEAIQETDRLTAKIIGERSAGARAALYESKLAGPVTAYTLEVNQLYQTAKELIKHDPKKAVALVGALWLYNQGYKAITGNKLNADPLQAGIDASHALTTGTDANGDPIGLGERLTRAGGRIAGEAVDAMPLGDTVAAQLYPQNGFHVPFAGGQRMLSRADVFGDTNLGRYGGGTPIASGIGNPLLLTGIPGISQLQKSVEGSNAYRSGASTTAGGNTRFTIDPNTENYFRALLFGQYGTKEGRAYLAGKNANLAGY